jgi:NAD(P)H-dependent FMN reductase
MSRVTIVGLGGSLAQHSTSLSALSVALDCARDYGADVQLFDLRELDPPMFVPDADSARAAREWCDAVFAAQRMLWSSPLYLRALGRELARAAQVFAAGTITTAETSKVEAQVEPLG